MRWGRPQFTDKLPEWFDSSDQSVQRLEVVFIAGILLMAGTGEMLERERVNIVINSCT